MLQENTNGTLKAQKNISIIYNNHRKIESGITLNKILIHRINKDLHFFSNHFILMTYQICCEL